jgi:hypothetical protein
MLLVYIVDRAFQRSIVNLKLFYVSLKFIKYLKPSNI